MIHLRSIQEIDKQYETAGSSPLLVTCNDYNDWVCKYHDQTIYLFNELIASEFLKIWEINTPDTALVKIDPLHVPVSKFPALSPNLFEKECFGSMFLKDCIDLNFTTINLLKDQSFVSKIKNKEDFLKIALFDIWMSNEDRNYNNNNLLLHTDTDNFKVFYAIDHVCIFNTSSINQNIYQLTEDDVIINTDIPKLLYKNKKNILSMVDNLTNKFYLCTEVCKTKLSDIIDLTPNSWKINTNDIKSKIEQQLFSDEWLNDCEKNFRHYIQTMILN